MLASVLVITACQKTIVTLQVGFVLGKTRARKWGLKAIIWKYAFYRTSMEEWSSNWEANVDMLLEQLYDAGMQDIIDEANRQLGLE